MSTANGEKNLINMESVDHNENECQSSRENPDVTDDLVDDVEKIKGGAIGKTLYCERWVLKILMKLAKLTEQDWNAELESDLCTLWDMTFEADITKFLIKHDFFSLMSHVMRISSNSRLLEIMVGTAGNMCCVDGTTEHILMSQDVLASLINLFQDPNPYVLIQYIRVVHSLVPSLEVNESWLQKQIEENVIYQQLIFIFQSSTNEELLRRSLDFLDSLLFFENKQDYTTYFFSTDMIEALITAWKQLFETWTDNDNFPSLALEKAATNWTRLIYGFTTLPDSEDVVFPYAGELGVVLNKIINRPIEPTEILVQSVHILTFLAPVYVEGAVFKRLLKIFDTIYTNAGSKTPPVPTSSTDLDMAIHDGIIDFCTSLKNSISKRSLKLLLNDCSESEVSLFWKYQMEEDNLQLGERTV